MFHKEIHLKKHYPLTNDPILEINRPILSDNDYDQPLTKAILVIPGGGYKFCSRREADPVVSTFLADNYCCFTLWYTLSTQYPVPQMEVMASIDYIKRHAKSLKVDVNKIAVIGFSAGGHLAASYGMLERDEELHSLLNIKDRDTTVSALVLSYPVITMMQATHSESRNIITGGDEKLKELLSVEKHVTKDYPPTFIWATNEDDCVPVINTIMMDNALKAAHVKHECVIYPHLWHGLSTASRCLNIAGYDEYEKDFKLVATWVSKAKRFLDKVMK